MQIKIERYVLAALCGWVLCSGCVEATSESNPISSDSGTLPHVDSESDTVSDLGTAEDSESETSEDTATGQDDDAGTDGDIDGGPDAGKDSSSG